MDKKTNTFNIAKSIVQKEGFSKLTIRKLAKESNISIGSVYNFFGTKENLINDIIRSYWDESIEKVLTDNKNSKDNTLDKLEDLYTKFFHTSDEFHSNWIHDLEGIRMSNKTIYNMSQGYLDMIIIRVQEILLDDEYIYIQFNDVFTLEKVSKLIHEMFTHSFSLNEDGHMEFLRYTLIKLFNLEHQ